MMVGRAVPVIIVRGIVRVAQSKCHNKRLLTWEVPGCIRTFLLAKILTHWKGSLLRNIRAGQGKVPIICVSRSGALLVVRSSSWGVLSLVAASK